ncbi:MAG: 3-phosphoserine/phosphohydroxythreonine transaminase [Eubacteriales bacterium]|nr:3-phosphoserine/phosphohydroxythreonine transaminase [Eubacteriales bacterium]MDD4476202.1 3-phosphoserine/phosphohydroxythreonine transaminase [Eubacteriales bacterium]
MSRVYNFSAGPSMLPLPVLEKAQKELIEQGGSGMSVMEMSHRSKPYEAIINSAEANLRKLMEIPDNYKVLFLQGGATLQFASVPMNLMKKGKADYIVSGQFSKKAADEAKKFGEVRIVASSADKNFSYVPTVSKSDFSTDADYVHICSNNTIFGTVYNYTPETGDIPLVADMSSNILSKPIDISKYGLIYAGAQKNMGPAGLTVVIVREDLIGNARAGTPTILDYKVQADNDSMYNTPACYSIYVAGLVFEWLLELGGLAEMEKINVRKAGKLYDYLDSSLMFKPTAEKAYRSIMNVCFVTGDEELDKKFCSEAAKAGFVNIKGHRSVGGMRASIYNAMPEEGIEKLVAFMSEFEKNNLKGR